MPNLRDRAFAGAPLGISAALRVQRGAYGPHNAGALDGLSDQGRAAAGTITGPICPCCWAEGPQSAAPSRLPFFGIAPQAKLHGEIREAARRHANLAIAALRRIRDHGESESARIAAAQALLDRGLGTVATAKVPDGPVARPLGKKEEASAAARDAASGRYATPPAPRLQ